MNDIYVRIIDFPTTKVSETVTENEDGSYTIFLNAKMSQEEIQKSYAHALGHIERNDFEKDNVQEIEYQAHRRDAI